VDGGAGVRFADRDKEVMTRRRCHSHARVATQVASCLASLAAFSRFVFIVGRFAPYATSLGVSRRPVPGRELVTRAPAPHIPSAAQRRPVPRSGPDPSHWAGTCPCPPCTRVASAGLARLPDEHASLAGYASLSILDRHATPPLCRRVCTVSDGQRTKPCPARRVATRTAPRLVHTSIPCSSRRYSPRPCAARTHADDASRACGHCTRRAVGVPSSRVPLRPHCTSRAVSIGRRHETCARRRWARLRTPDARSLPFPAPPSSPEAATRGSAAVCARCIG
jgi:hypothetical protein